MIDEYDHGLMLNLHAKNVLHVTQITHLKLIYYFNLKLVQHGRGHTREDNIINLQINYHIIRFVYLFYNVASNEHLQ